MDHFHAVYGQQCLFLFLRRCIKTFINLHAQINFPKGGFLFSPSYFQKTEFEKSSLIPNDIQSDLKIL